MYSAKILTVDPITPDVKRFRIERPQGFSFETGDATELALDMDGWREAPRPFTMTSLPVDGALEFTIKEYPDHDGVTKRLHKLLPGDSVLVADPFKTFRYDSPGVFIAGGAGITPFLAIFRALLQKNKLAGNTLIFANKKEADIIQRHELEGMKDLTVINVLSEETVPGMRHVVVTADLIREVVPDTDKPFYLCGPDAMMDAVTKDLTKLGISPEAVKLSD